MLIRLFLRIFPKEQPDWFRGMNMIIVLPILAWPLVLFMGIFMFDNPFQDQRKTFLQFFGVIAYPIYLGLLAYMNSRLYNKNRMLGIIATVSVILTFLLGLGYVIFKFFVTSL
jgi:hypothetical protein